MKTTIEFSSKKFPARPEESEEVNPGRFGRALAEFVSEHLRAKGYITSAIIAEDWGWIVQIQNKEFPVWVGCGNYEEFEDGFLCFLEPAKPVIRKWFRKIDTLPVMEKLAGELEKVLRLPEASATRIRWWSATEVKR